MKFFYLLAVVGTCLSAPTVAPEFDELPEARDEIQGTNALVGGFGSTQPLPTFPWNGGQGSLGGSGGAPFGGMIPEGNQNNQFGGFGGFGGQENGNTFGNQNPFGGQQGSNNGAPFGGMIPEGNQGNNGFGLPFNGPTTASWIGQQGNGIFPGNNGFGGFNGQQGNQENFNGNLGNQGNFNGNQGNQGNFNNNGFGGNQQGGFGGAAVTDITGPLNTLLQNVLNSLKSQVTGFGNAISSTDMDNLVSQLLNPAVPQDQKQTLVQNALNSIQEAATRTKMQQMTTALTSASTQLQGQNQQVQQAVSQILSLPFDQESSQLPVQQLQSQVQNIVTGLSQQDEEALFTVMNRFNIDINKPAAAIGTQ